MDLNLFFRRLAYVQILLGIVAFCLAERNPEMLIISGALAALSWYIVEGPSGRPVPQPVLLLVMVLMAGWVATELRRGDAADPVRVVGHFTLWVQVILLYGAKRSLRDYAPLLVLSLLQMIGATLVSTSVLVGALLLGYCVLALLTTLVFEFKAAGDQVHEATRRLAPPGYEPERPVAVTGRGYGWHLRGLVLFMGAVCVLAALATFLFMPRPAAATLSVPWSPWTLPGSPARVTGFSPTINMNAAPPAPNADDRAILHLAPVDPQLPRQDHYYLRGAVLAEYLPWTRLWRRGANIDDLEQTLDLPPDGALALLDAPAASPSCEFDITLNLRTTSDLFTLEPTTRITSAALASVSYNPLDQRLAVIRQNPGVLRYRVTCPQIPVAGIYTQTRYAPVDMRPAAQILGRDEYARGWSVQRDRLARLGAEILAAYPWKRDPRAVVDEHDLHIAQVLCLYLRDHYSYTLTNPPLEEGQDPVTTFLFQQRQGHCEVFAAALTALCRSLGLRARLVTGYLAHDYNQIGGYFTVRQNDAHAWVEVFTTQRGWAVFDPTPADRAGPAAASRGIKAWSHDMFEYLEDLWNRGVTHYGRTSRAALLENLSAALAGLRNDHSWAGRALETLRQSVQQWSFSAFDTGMLFLIVAAIALALGLLLHVWLVRRRRLEALQLTRVPGHQRRQLARNLGFYLTMLDMLERHGWRRPPWQPPLAFARDLARRQPDKFTPVQVLTELFYEIRFGYRPLDADRRQIVRTHLHRLEETLGRK